MFEKFIKRSNNRLKGFDYSQEGFYFVTISTKNNMNYFGEIIGESIQLNEMGKIAEKYWLEIPINYTNIEIDTFTIMSNHLHGVIFIKETQSTDSRQNYGTLSKVINSYKNIVTKTIRKKCNEPDFGWHRSFYDHVIRHEKSLDRIREYIIQNPIKLFLEKNMIDEL